MIERIKVKNKFIQKTVVCLLALYYLYPFKMQLAIWSIVNAIYMIVPVAYCVYRYKFLFMSINKIQKNNLVRISLIALFISLLYAMMICFFSGDFSFISESYLKPLWKFLRFLFIYLIVVDAYGKENTFFNYIRVLSYASAIYVCFTLFMMINHTFMYYWLSLVSPDLEVIYIWQDFNRIGLMGRTNADTSIMLSMIIVGVCINIRMHGKINRAYKISVLLILVGNVLYGRLGLLLSIVTFVLFFGNRWCRRLNVNKLIRGVLVVLLVIIVGISIGNLIDSDVLNYTINLALEPIKAILSSKIGSVSLGHSGDELFNKMYFWMGIDTFLIGDGFFQTASGDRYMQTDPALMRKILFGGIGQITLMYISVFALVKAFYKKFKVVDKSVFWSGCVSLFLIFALGEIKDTVYSNWFVVCLMFIIALTNDYFLNGKQKVNHTAH